MLGVTGAYRELAQTVESILRSCQEELSRNLGKSEPLYAKSLSATDIVTELDRSVEQKICEALRAAYPGIPILGEEFSPMQPIVESYWVVDPIDGTGNYVRGLPTPTSVISLVHDGSVVVSGVLVISTGEITVATHEQGAWAGGERLSVSDRRLKDAYVVLDMDVRTSNAALELFRNLQSRCVLVSSASASWELLQVASGRYDARISRNGWNKPWDLAPGSLLVKESGGVVCDGFGEIYTPSSTSQIVGNRTVVAQLLEILAR